MEIISHTLGTSTKALVTGEQKGRGGGVLMQDTCNHRHPRSSRGLMNDESNVNGISSKVL
jgi:hypothetical protein